MLEYVDSELVPGVFFIDEIYMLDIEFFTFLNVLWKSEHDGR